MLLLSALMLAACNEPVLSARGEDEANTALAALSRGGVQARKVLGGRGVFDVVVPSRRLDRALEILSAAGLPRAPEPGLAELFPEPGLVPSPSEERARYHLAVAGELGSTLRSLAGIREARVHLGLPDEPSRRLRTTPREQVKASVLLLVEPGEIEGQEANAASIRELVAGAVTGLEAAAVTVVVSEARALPRAVANESDSRSPALLAAGSLVLAIGLALACFACVLYFRRAGKEAPL